MINEFGVSLFLISIVFIMWVLSSILFNIRKKKGIISLILSLIFTFFASYYVYLVFYSKKIMSTFENEKINKTVMKQEVAEKKSNNEILLVLKINDDYIKVGLENEIEIKKDANFIISDVEGIDKENLKANLIGFVGNTKYNDGQDIGYKINYKDLRKDKAIGENKYEIEIKKDNKKVGSVFLKFVD